MPVVQKIFFCGRLIFLFMEEKHCLLTKVFFWCDNRVSFIMYYKKYVKNFMDKYFYFCKVSKKKNNNFFTHNNLLNIQIRRFSKNNKTSLIKFKKINFTSTFEADFLKNMCTRISKITSALSYTFTKEDLLYNEQLEQTKNLLSCVNESSNNGKDSKFFDTCEVIKDDLNINVLIHTESENTYALSLYEKKEITQKTQEIPRKFFTGDLEYVNLVLFKSYTIYILSQKSDKILSIFCYNILLISGIGGFFIFVIDSTVEIYNSSNAAKEFLRITLNVIKQCLDIGRKIFPVIISMRLGFIGIIRAPLYMEYTEKALGIEEDTTHASLAKHNFESLTRLHKIRDSAYITTKQFARTAEQQKMDKAIWRDFSAFIIKNETYQDCWYIKKVFLYTFNKNQTNWYIKKTFLFLYRFHINEVSRNQGVSQEQPAGVQIPQNAPERIPERGPFVPAVHSTVNLRECTKTELWDNLLLDVSSLQDLTLKEVENLILTKHILLGEDTAIVAREMLQRQGELHPINNNNNNSDEQPEAPDDNSNTNESVPLDTIAVKHANRDNPQQISGKREKAKISLQINNNNNSDEPVPLDTIAVKHANRDNPQQISGKREKTRISPPINNNSDENFWETGIDAILNNNNNNNILNPINFTPPQSQSQESFTAYVSRTNIARVIEENPLSIKFESFREKFCAALCADPEYLGTLEGHGMFTADRMVNGIGIEKSLKNDFPFWVKTSSEAQRRLKWEIYNIHVSAFSKRISVFFLEHYAAKNFMGEDGKLSKDVKACFSILMLRTLSRLGPMEGGMVEYDKTCLYNFNRTLEITVDGKNTKLVDIKVLKTFRLVFAKGDYDHAFRKYYVEKYKRACESYVDDLIHNDKTNQEHKTLLTDSLIEMRRTIEEDDIEKERLKNDPKERAAILKEANIRREKHKQTLLLGAKAKSKR